MRARPGSWEIDFGPGRAVPRPEVLEHGAPVVATVEQRLLVARVVDEPEMCATGRPFGRNLPPGVFVPGPRLGNELAFRVASPEQQRHVTRRVGDHEHVVAGGRRT